MAFPGDGVAPNICRREYMAEHFYRLRAISATLACEEANSKLVDVDDGGFGKISAFWPI